MKRARVAAEGLDGRALAGALAGRDVAMSGVRPTAVRAAAVRAAAVRAAAGGVAVVAR